MANIAKERIQAFLDELKVDFDVLDITSALTEIQREYTCETKWMEKKSTLLEKYPEAAGFLDMVKFLDFEDNLNAYPTYARVEGIINNQIEFDSHSPESGGIMGGIIIDGEYYQFEPYNGMPKIMMVLMKFLNITNVTVRTMINIFDVIVLHEPYNDFFHIESYTEEELEQKMH